MAKDCDDGPWSPGLTSSIPSRLMPKVTLYDPVHGLVPWETAKNLSDMTGLKPQELATFRPERLAMHHVLIRVTTETHVPDGQDYAALGISLRQMAADILASEIHDARDAIDMVFNTARVEARALVDEELQTHIFGTRPVEQPPKTLLSWLSKPKEPPPEPSIHDRALVAHKHWDEASKTDNPLRRAVTGALARVVGAVLAHRGALHVPRDVLTDIAVNLVSNTYGCDQVGAAVAPLFDKAIGNHGLKRLPAQSEPVVLNAKGASASGKSTIRGQQRRIAEKLNIPWTEFAVISPDYWRKMMIDYDGLGEDFKYGAMMTGQELEIIDRKLDALMAANAKAGNVPHMLIDRFRFDSFQSGPSRSNGSALLTRFGARVYMFFLVTPPEETVPRAWYRGLETGRFKAVDDLLDHNIEAYTGMPDLFFTWATSTDRWAHYEFLDNSVPLGKQPRTIAFGQNACFVVADLDKLCDIERFRHVNVDAKCPDDVLSRVLSTSEAMAFARRIISKLPEVLFLEPNSDQVFAKSTNGQVTLIPDKVPAPFSPEDFGEYRVATGDLGQLPDDARSDVIGG